MRAFTCYHAPAAYAFRDRDLTLQLLLPDEESSLVELFLCYAVEGTALSAELRMLPVDGIVVGESYSAYAVTVPAADLAGGTALRYHFKRKGEVGDTYCIPLQDAPKMPPFIVSEFFPWGNGLLQCAELYNPGTETVDLYDYELLLLNQDGEEHKRDPLADAAGVNLLAPGELGVLDFISWAIHKERDAHGDEEDLVFSHLAAQYPETCADLAERHVKWMEVELACKDEKGEWCSKEGCFGIYSWINERKLAVVPRGGTLSDAVYRMSINPDRQHLHVHKFRSSLWTVDPLEPSVAICTHPRVMPTPGYAEPHQFLPLAHAVTVPAILPLEPEGRVHLSNGDCRFTFAVLGREVALPTVWVKVQETYRAYPAELNNDGIFEAVLPAEVLSHLPGKLEYYIEVKGGLYTANYGTADAPCTRKVTDNAGPSILRSYPAEGQVLEREQSPEISLSYDDISGVNLRTSILCVDGKNVSTMADWQPDGVRYRPQKPLAYGKHTFEVSLRDTLGNRTYRKVSFGICDGSKMECYRGEVHCHTLESDGLGSPADAFTYARDEGKVDYFAVTDHSHYLTLEEMRAQRRVAEGFNVNGKYATTHGFEMTWNYMSGFWGHMNVLNTDWITPYHEEIDLYTFYDMLTADPDAIGMFNHPCDTWGMFDDFDVWTKERDEKMCLAEIRGGGFDRGYTLMLSKGWHAAPVANEDNHAANWTTATTTTGYVLAPSLTRENVLEAFRRRRTYTTCDNTMQIRYRVNGEWMGSRLQAPKKLSMEVEITTENENGIGLLSIVTEDNIVVARIDAGPLREFNWHVELDPDFDYYYLRANNGSLYSVTSPVFVEGRDLLNISRMDYGVCAEDAEMPHVVEVTVENSSDKPMKDVSVQYYVTPLGGFELRNLTPFASVHIGKLEAGKSHTVARRFPTVPGRRRITAVVSGYRGKERFADTTYRLITPVRIGKMLPQTSSVTIGEEEIKNPFRYVELYNPMPHAVSLDKYTLKLWHASGVAPQPERCLALDGYTIPAGGTLTVWVRPAAAPLTVADFNTRYGTSLVEGKDLIVTENRILTANGGGHMLDLVFQKEIVSRATFGKYCVLENDIAEDVPLVYGDFAPMNMRQRKLTLPEEAKVLPGSVQKEQIPAAKRGGCRRREAVEAEKAVTKRSIITRLTEAPLVPLQAAKLIASAVSAVKHILKTKE
ncbi:MAG: hypothetical protein E7590_06780 [Ruminococcaceae bacterium]|nr:hypothetical protein [Oscillospiraceae bacterium]